MEMYELPLVIFTVIGQAAVGMLLLVSLLESFASAKDQGALKALRMAGIAVFPLLVVALVASLFHLGTPMGAIRALRGFGSAWLSREIYAFGLLSLIGLGYSYLWWTGRSPALRRTLGYAGSAVGLVAVWVTAMVYVLPARPAWTPVTNTLTFLATALFLGGMIVGQLVKVYGKEETAVAKISAAAGTASGLALVLIVAALGSLALQGQADPRVAMAAQATFGSWLFWARLLVGILLPTAVVGNMLLRGKAIQPAVLSLALVGALAGEMMGRALFYASVMGPNVWGM